MRLSREALMKLEAEAAADAAEAKASDAALGVFEPFGVEMTGGDKPRHVKVRVSGLKSIYLASICVEGSSSLFVADPKLIDKDGKATPVDVRRPKHQRKRMRLFGSKRIRASKGPVKVRKQTFEAGAKWENTEALLELDGKYEWFEAWVWPADRRGRGRIRFTVDWQGELASVARRRSDRGKIWDLIHRDFGEAAAAKGIRIEDPHGIWQKDWTPGDVGELARRYAGATQVGDLKRKAEALARSAKTPADLAKVRELYRAASRFDRVRRRAEEANVEALGLAITDMTTTFPSRYPKGPEYLRVLGEFVARRGELVDALGGGDEGAVEAAGKMLSVLREALLANPLLDFGELIVLRRNFGRSAGQVMSGPLGLPSLNSRTHDTIPHKGWDNEIAVMTDLRGGGKLRTLYRPPDGEIVCELDLHFDADRLMFSSIGAHDRWALLEISLGSKGGGTQPRQLTPTDLPDVDFFDSCYMPDGTIAVTSTATYQGLPCENGGRPMAVLYKLDPETKHIRQLTFEQDSDWSPVMRPDGRLMYLRWEYTDTPHYFTRVLFHCNPDGTEQMEYYGSNSYFPNAFFYARPIPGHATKVVGIAGGHHGISRSGRLLILDPALGRHEADGVVQEIPRRGRKVEPIMKDRMVEGVWPQFLYTHPLGDTRAGLDGGKYFLASVKPSEQSLWGIYLVDVFDNMTLVKEIPGAALLEPVPFEKTPAPPVVPEKYRRGSKYAVVFLTDLYYGPGLEGVPRGTVKKLRVVAYHFNYLGTGGHASVGVESGWDIKRVLGTVPVERDGSALFKVPANTPVCVQPLDGEGRAVALMRSWFVGMPGEIVSCVGCHEPQNIAVPNVKTIASRREPSTIEPWHGSVRPFGYRNEVQPVLDRYCVGCHNGAAAKGAPNFKADGDPGSYENDKPYMALQPYVHRQGPEGDYHRLLPMEYHASTSELVQMIEKGHHNVRPAAAAWETFYTWIDLNAPWRGKWTPRQWRGREQRRRRMELVKMYAGVEWDPEGEYDARAAALAKRGPIEPITPEPLPARKVRLPKVAGWPFGAAEAKRKQADAAQQVELTIDLPAASGGTLSGGRNIEPSSGRGGSQAPGGPGPAQMKFALVPAGEFVMGAPKGHADERPVARVKIERPFWMSTCEVTNAQFARFDPSHDSRYIDMAGKNHRNRGHPANRPEQPVVRVTWRRATAFCEWLSDRTGRECSLPTEAQWEWACRAGADTAMWYGKVDADFSKFANFADKASVRTTPYPRNQKHNDGQGIPSGVGRYQPNPWGLSDMHGGVWEWTCSTYRPYPYADTDGRNGLATGGRKVARGGSWRDRPHRGRSAFRLAYEAWQPVFNVGFRVVLEARRSKIAARTREASNTAPGR